MKEMRTQLIWCCVALASFILKLFIPYVQGRMNTISLLPNLLPFLLLFVSCIVLLSLLIRSIFTRRHKVVTAFMFLFALCLLVGSLKVRPAYFFLRGFHDYAKNVLTVDEWRSIDQFAQTNIQTSLPGPGKWSLWDEKEHRALWSQLISATHVQKLRDSLVISVRPRSTSLTWGGALAGHWAVTIYSGTNSAKDSDSNFRYFRRLPIAEDIDASISSD